MFKRLSYAKIAEHLQWSPAVGILGPRQVGKTTLAKTLARESGKSIYLDLDTAQARAQLVNPTAFFAANRDRLIVLDEIQNQPELLSELRGEIDADRRMSQQHFASSRCGHINIVPLQHFGATGRMNAYRLWHIVPHTGVAFRAPTDYPFRCC